MTQYQKIETYVDRFGSITSMEAYTIGVTQLATRIKEMKENKGKAIQDDWVLKPNGSKHYKRYFING